MAPSDIWYSIDHKLIGILRGITPPETEEIVVTLLNAVFRAVEIPLNSPDPLRSIEIAGGRRTLCHSPLPDRSGNRSDGRGRGTSPRRGRQSDRVPQHQRGRGARHPAL